nr:MAG TPA: hypothetical protein [Caudoviricetes sp.]
MNASAESLFTFHVDAEQSGRRNMIGICNLFEVICNDWECFVERIIMFFAELIDLSCCIRLVSWSHGLIFTVDLFVECVVLG